MLNYVPFATRIALSLVDTDDRHREKALLSGLPPFAIEGEVQWHADLLMWHAVEISGRAFLLPADKHDEFFAKAAAALSHGGALTSAEVYAVIACAKHRLAPSRNSPLSREEWARHLAFVEQQKESLEVRLTLMHATAQSKVREQR